MEGEAGAAPSLQGYLFGELRELLASHRLERPVHLEVHGQIEPFDKVEARRELGKSDDADLGDVGQGLVHLKPPEGAFHDSPEPGASKAPGRVSLAGPLLYVSLGLYVPKGAFDSPAAGKVPVESP